MARQVFSKGVGNQGDGRSPAAPGRAATASQPSPERVSGIAGIPNADTDREKTDYEKTAGMRALTGWIDFEAFKDTISPSIRRAEVRYTNGTTREDWANQFAWGNVCNPSGYRITAFRVTQWDPASPEGRRDALGRKAMLYRLLSEGEPHAEVFARVMPPRAVDFAFVDLLVASGIVAAEGGRDPKGLDERSEQSPVAKPDAQGEQP